MSEATTQLYNINQQTKSQSTDSTVLLIPVSSQLGTSELLSTYQHLTPVTMSDTSASLIDVHRVGLAPASNFLIPSVDLHTP